MKGGNGKFHTLLLVDLLHGNYPRTALITGVQLNNHFTLEGLLVLGSRMRKARLHYLTTRGKAGRIGCWLVAGGKLLCDAANYAS